MSEKNYPPTLWCLCDSGRKWEGGSCRYREYKEECRDDYGCSGDLECVRGIGMVWGKCGCKYGLSWNGASCEKRQRMTSPTTVLTYTKPKPELPDVLVPVFIIIIIIIYGCLWSWRKRHDLRTCASPTSDSAGCIRSSGHHPLTNAGQIRVSNSTTGDHFSRQTMSLRPHPTSESGSRSILFNHIWGHNNSNDPPSSSGGAVTQNEALEINNTQRHENNRRPDTPTSNDKPPPYHDPPSYQEATGDRF